MVTITAEQSGRRLAGNVERAGLGPVRFTYADALEMVKHQILPEDISIELLNGQLVYRDRFDLMNGVVTCGPKHRYVVCLLADLAMQINNSHRRLASQFELECTKWHVPIADAVILRGCLESWRDHFPTATDAFCVVEVADSSYERDTGEKLFGYARAGIPQYVIINLRNRTAEVYTQPDLAAGTYSPPLIVAEGQSLSLKVGDAEFFTVPMVDLLP